jgi:hypothetical protein
LQKSDGGVRMNNEIVLYQADELSSRIDVRVEAETVWLNRNQLAVLFNRDVKTIGKHINNVFSEGELDKNSTVANFATVQKTSFQSREYFMTVRFLMRTISFQICFGARKSPFLS